MKNSPLFRNLAMTAALVAVVIFATGCPLLIPQGKAQITVLLTNDTGKMGPVEIDSIESFFVTVTEISLDGPADDDDSDDDSEDDDSKGAEDEGDDDDEGEDDDGSKTVVFEGALRVNLVDLMEVSEVLSTEEIPAGKYTKIRMCVEDPELTLTGESEPLENVNFTANGKVFVSKQFTLEDGEQQLIILNFNGLHLVEQGNGEFRLTPQLRADISVESAESMATGTIANLDTEMDMFTVDFGEDGSVEVVYTDETQIFLPGDEEDTPTGTEGDLADGLTVEVEGTLSVDQTLTATVIRIVS